MSENGGEPQKFVAAFDIHIGKEYKQVRGERKLLTTHDPRALKSFFAFCRDFNPDVFILGGDQLNCGPISHWHHGKPRLDETFRLKWEMDTLDKLVLVKAESVVNKRLIWMDGNHELWVQQYLDQNPGVEGLIEPENYLNLKKRGWELYSQGEIFKLGKLHFVHGDTIRGTKYRAQKLVNDYRRNIRAGHFHTYEIAPDINPMDVKDTHTGVVVPTLSRRGPAYQKNAPDRYIQGFLCGWVYPDGTFQDQVVYINKGKCCFNGKVYNGN